MLASGSENVSSADAMNLQMIEEQQEQSEMFEQEFVSKYVADDSCQVADTEI